MTYLPLLQRRLQFLRSLSFLFQRLLLLRRLSIYPELQILDLHFQFDAPFPQCFRFSVAFVFQILPLVELAFYIRVLASEIIARAFEFRILRLCTFELKSGPFEFGCCGFACNLDL